MIKEGLLTQIITEEINKFIEEEGLKRSAALAAFLAGAGMGKTALPAEPAPVQQPEQDPSTEPEEKKKPLPKGFESLQMLKGQLVKLNPQVFNTQSTEGRAALAIALSIGGTEVYGRGHKGKDFFSVLGGRDLQGAENTMKGFAQFNTKYHGDKISTPEKYVKFLGDIITGKRSMPNGKTKIDAVNRLVQDIESEKIRDKADFKNWLRTNNFGGSNWQGIDDGWERVPGLADWALNFIKGNSSNA